MPQDHLLIARWLVHATWAYLQQPKRDKVDLDKVYIRGSEVRESVLVQGF